MHSRNNDSSGGYGSKPISTVGDYLGSVNLSIEEYLALLEAARQTKDLAVEVRDVARDVVSDAKKVKRKASAYSRRYKAAFRKIKKDYQTVSGRWRKNGFKRAVRAAHRMAKK